MPDIVVVHESSLFPLGSLHTSLDAEQIRARGAYELWLPVLQDAPRGAIAHEVTATAAANRVPLMRLASRQVVGPGGCEMTVLLASHARLALELPYFNMTRDAQDALMRCARRHAVACSDYFIAHAYGESPLHFLRRAYPDTMRVVEDEWDAEMSASLLSPYSYQTFNVVGVDYARSRDEVVWAAARHYGRNNFQYEGRATRSPPGDPVLIVDYDSVTNSLPSHNFAELEGRVLAQVGDRMSQMADALMVETLLGASPPVKREPPRVTTRVYSYVRRALDVGGG